MRSARVRAIEVAESGVRFESDPLYKFVSRAHVLYACERDIARREEDLRATEEKIANLRKGMTPEELARVDAMIEKARIDRDKRPKQEDRLSIEQRSCKKYPIADEMGAMIKQGQLETYLEKSWALLTEQEQKTVSERFYKEVTKVLSVSLEPRAKEVILSFAVRLAEAELEKKKDEISARVTKEIEARWEAAVEGIVQRRLDAAIAKIKTEMGK